MLYLINNFGHFCGIDTAIMANELYKDLIEDSNRIAELVSLDFIRPIANTISWDWRLNGLKGPRGVGKTTILQQQMIRNDPDLSHSIYFSLDDLIFFEHNLRSVFKYFYDRGIRYFYLDEVHKYPTWAREIKNIYDFFPKAFITFTGSAIIQMEKQDVDLSRRALIFNIPGLSFREFLVLGKGLYFDALSLEDIISRRNKFDQKISSEHNILAFFKEYLETGYYPFFLESITYYKKRLREISRLIIETDLAYSEGGNVKFTQKLFRLMQVLAESVPVKPNISKLSNKLQIDRGTLYRYLTQLHRAQLISMIPGEGKGMTTLQKPEKIYLDNPNLAYALSPGANIGNIRETFFQNQLRMQGFLEIPKQGDFVLDEKYRFEVGGESKKIGQLPEGEHSYYVLDNIPFGTGNRIPLWAFGFLY